jgi:Outer membrane protein and related peptidoglycan-associated (lipo)proteins
MRKMTIKNLVVAVVFFAVTIPVMAQESTVLEDKKSDADKNWFISAGVSGNLLVGEQDDEYGNLGDRIRLGGELSIGKWFNPNFGMRTQFMLGGLKGFNFNEHKGGEYTRNDRDRDPYPIGYYKGTLKAAGDAGFWQQFSYGTATIDLMANLTNLFRGYYREAPVEFIPFVGIGFIHASKSETNPTFNNIVGKLGMRVNFNLNSQFAIYLEPQANFTSAEFDGYVGNRNMDAIGNVIAGVQFNINKNFAKATTLSQTEVDMLNRKINEQYSMIENQQTILERQQKMLQEMGNKQPESKDRQKPVEIVAGDASKYLPDYIRFGLNSSNIDISEKHKVEDAAAYLKANPESRLLLIGYADRQTGNSKYNYDLSCRRVESVARQLRDLGINSNRLIIQCIGDKEQPYDQNEWNRVVIMVERK